MSESGGGRRLVALVSGGNRGLGRAVAADLMARGCRVFLGARNLIDGIETAKELNASVANIVSRNGIAAAAAAAAVAPNGGDAKAECQAIALDVTNR
eukprot:UC1_evm1s1562